MLLAGRRRSAVSRCWAPLARHCLVVASLTLVYSVQARAQERGAQPPLLTRAEWGAKPALPGMRPHKPVSIIVHHTGVKQNPRVGMAAKLRNLQSYSQKVAEFAPGRKKPAWPDLPYHYYIDAKGVIAEGRDVRYAGDTNTGYDTSGHVQVVLEGDFERERPTQAQLDALRQVLAWQAAAWRIPISKISVHKDHARTDCPGKNLLAELPKVMAGLRD